MHSNIEKKREYERKYKAAHRETLRAQARQRRVRLGDSIRAKESLFRRGNTLRGLINAAKCRAKRLGVPFTVCLADLALPSRCPVCNVEIVRNNSRPRGNSPSIDRMIPALGYTRENAWVICNGCNQAKSAFRPEQMIFVLNEMLRRGLIGTAHYTVQASKAVA